MQSTSNYRDIKATPAKIYQALTEPAALETWQAPGTMTGKVHQFDLREGGGYEMSLYYPASEKGAPGKTNDKEDRFRVRFLELVPGKKIRQSVRFDSPDPGFKEEMTMEITLDAIGDSTRVTFAFHNIPKTIRPEDNEAGTLSSLEKLAHYVE